MLSDRPMVARANGDHTDDDDEESDIDCEECGGRRDEGVLRVIPGVTLTKWQPSNLV